MQRFLKLFGSWIQFFYLCFDRVVINGYLSLLTRENNVVYFFREVCGVSKITQEVLRKRTDDYQKWVKGYAANRGISMEWAIHGVRKEEWVRPALERCQKRGAFGVYFILQSMEQGPSFRIKEPKFPTEDPDYMILKKQRGRFTHYYFYIHDEVVGPMVLRVASFLPFTVTAYLNGHSFILRSA